jgi:hypothetical protein
LVGQPSAASSTSLAKASGGRGDVCFDQAGKNKTAFANSRPGFTAKGHFVERRKLEFRASQLKDGALSFNLVGEN